MIMTRKMDGHIFFLSVAFAIKMMQTFAITGR